MEQEKKLFLLDAMALIYRAYFALQRSPRITSKGRNTNAQFGFTNTLGLSPPRLLRSVAILLILTESLADIRTVIFLILGFKDASRRANQGDP